MKKRVAPLLDMADEEIAALVPARRPIRGTSLADMGREYRGKLGWTPRKPRRLSIGRASFIPENRFPVAGVTKVKGPDGTEWEYEYATNEAGKRVYVTSVRDSVARDWLMRAAQTLSTLYAATGDTLYARKVVSDSVPLRRRAGDGQTAETAGGSAALTIPSGVSAVRLNRE